MWVYSNYPYFTDEKFKREVSEKEPTTFRICLLFYYWYNSNC